ncbi:MAG: MmcQ/YjbR family DNA-binding protein [Solirubrobacteraceae bacterium]
MASFDDVRRIALRLPGTDERVSRGHAQWRVNEKLFVWERPLGNKDIDWMGSRMRDAPILGARVEHLIAKEAVLADDPAVFFTTPHFDGYPAILVWLDRIDERRYGRRSSRHGSSARRRRWPTLISPAAQSDHARRYRHRDRLTGQPSCVVPRTPGPTRRTCTGAVTVAATASPDDSEQSARPVGLGWPRDRRNG